MERLTYRLNDQCDNPTDSIILKPYLRYEDPETRKKILNRLAAYEDTGLEPEEIKKHEAAYNECLTRTYGPFKQKISQWLQAEQNGKLVVIPWAAGDVIYEADPAHGVVKHTFAGDPAWMMHSYAVDDAGNEWYDGWGSSDETPFYKTREEAEAALAQEGGIHEADSV